MSIYSSVNGYSVCFYLLTFVNNTAVNAVIQVSVQVPAFRFFGYVEVEFLGHMLIILLLSFCILIMEFLDICPFGFILFGTFCVSWV